MTLRLREILPTLAALRDGRLLFTPRHNYLQTLSALWTRSVSPRQSQGIVAVDGGEASWLWNWTWLRDSHD